MDEEKLVSQINEINIFVGKTAEYRESLNMQLVDIKNNQEQMNGELINISKALLTLPCPERAVEKNGLLKLCDEKHKNITEHIKGIWGVIMIVIIGGIVFGFWVKLVLAK